MLEWQTGVYVKSLKVPVISYKQGYGIVWKGMEQEKDALSRDSMRTLQLQQWVKIM